MPKVFLCILTNFLVEVLYLQAFSTVLWRNSPLYILDPFSNPLNMLKKTGKHSYISSITSFLTRNVVLFLLGADFIFVNFVSTILPLYYLSLFKLPSWVIKKIDSIRSKFLWRCNKKDASFFHHLVN